MIAAVDIWGPAFRVTPRRIPELAAQAREAAAAISVRLGGTAGGSSSNARERGRRRSPHGPRNGADDGLTDAAAPADDRPARP